MKFFDDFKSDLQECSVFRINDLGEDETALCMEININYGKFEKLELF